MSANSLSRALPRSRCAGVLLHPTSLPGTGANGTLGEMAFRFVDWLSECGFSVWQTLPPGPVDAYGSPYSLSSAFAGDIRLIDAPALKKAQLLPDVAAAHDLQLDPLPLYRAFATAASARQRDDFDAWYAQERDWLEPHAMFERCAQRFGSRAWWTWPADFAQRADAVLMQLLHDEREAVLAYAFRQYLFFVQWSALRTYANERRIALFGDLPFYMDRASADVWWEREGFQLDAHGAPLAVAGVPPDYFSEDGQLWGNPLYDWNAMQADGFSWWRRRLKFQLQRFDLLRIDHFRALESYWCVPADAESARDGHWEPGAGDALLSVVQNEDSVPLVAEDLGLITDAVHALRDRFDLPGMAVLQFGFDGSPDNPHLPQNVRERSVYYTGTHDNDTLYGWFESLPPHVREAVGAQLGLDVGSLPEALIDTALQTRAQLVMLPMQDLLGLDSGARMNTPGVADGNWRWRFAWEQVPAGLPAELQARLDAAGR